VPAVFSDTIDPELLKDILADSLHRVDTANKTVDEAINDILADLACYPSITGNSTLTDGTIVDLIETLDTCNNPYSCPHGRPVIIEISFDEIESRFERDYPGHP
ncbi:MAG: DNA mismatch repair protein MutL, partial [Halobacteriaceae archaeon]